MAVLSLVVLASGGCSRGDGATVTQEQPPKAPGSQLVRASDELLAECQATADSVGYPVPCPTRVPEGLRATRSIGGCEVEIIGPGGVGGCARSWRGWVVGSSETNDQHLVIVASPRPLRNYAKVVNGPAWYRDARVRPLGWVTIDGWRMRAVYVPFGTNDGSAFARHVVLIWTVGDHTYAIGFHDVHGIGQTLDLDRALARRLKLVAPNQS
jgi:hypothetical protein